MGLSKPAPETMMDIYINIRARSYLMGVLLYTFSACTYVRLVMLWLFGESCLYACTYVRAFALLGVLLYMHALMFIWSFFSPGFGSIESLALYACTFVCLVMLWFRWESCFIHMHLCSFVHAVTLLGILLYMHSLILVWSCCDYWKYCLYAYAYVSLVQQ